MGKVLQIRVSAVTWNEDLIEENWPRLAELAFSVPIKLENHGLMEMVRALCEGLQFEKWSEARKKAMGPGIEQACAIRGKIEKALADWDPKLANGLSNELENTLDKLESAYTA